MLPRWYTSIRSASDTGVCLHDLTFITGDTDIVLDHIVAFITDYSRIRPALHAGGCTQGLTFMTGEMGIPLDHIVAVFTDFSCVRPALHSALRSTGPHCSVCH